MWKLIRLSACFRLLFRKNKFVRLFKKKSLICTIKRIPVRPGLRQLFALDLPRFESYCRKSFCIVHLLETILLVNRFSKKYF